MGASTLEEARKSEKSFIKFSSLNAEQNRGRRVGTESRSSSRPTSGQPEDEL